MTAGLEKERKGCRLMPSQQARDCHSHQCSSAAEQLVLRTQIVRGWSQVTGRMLKFAAPLYLPGRG